MRIPPIALGIALVLGACSSPESSTVPDLPDLPNGAQAVSLLGDTLYVTIEPDSTQLEQLATAEAAYRAHPDNADSIIWYGRRTAYLQHYREAIRIYSEGIEKHPTDARMYRHRGHRYISIRMFDEAIADFERAAELIAGQEDQVEPDGNPNAAGIPLTTTHSNIWYHLGLARYLKQDFEGAIAAYRNGLSLRDNDDGLVSMSHWIYMSLRRLGRDDEAALVLEPITADLEIIENFSYHQLLLMYKGEITPESLLGEGDGSPENSATMYGVGCYHLYNDRGAQAHDIYHDIVDAARWDGFGYIAAEADLLQMHNH